MTTNNTTKNAQMIDDTTIDRFIDATICEHVARTTFAIIDVQTSFAFNATTTHDDEHDMLNDMLISTL